MQMIVAAAVVVAVAEISEEFVVILVVLLVVLIMLAIQLVVCMVGILHYDGDVYTAFHMIMVKRGCLYHAFHQHSL